MLLGDHPCRFEDMLRGLTTERESICTAMAFCLDNAESAYEITEVRPPADALLCLPKPPPTQHDMQSGGAGS